jgi:hypothetical protein
VNDDTASPGGPDGTVCLRRPNPLGIVALSGAAWLGTGLALALAGLPPLWAAGLGYLLAPLAVLALLAALRPMGTGPGETASAAAAAEWDADRAREAHEAGAARRRVA